ncbi:MAG TPA: LD-carboxypeptidase, partial [Burkholderiaceae bacterium]
MLALLAAAPAVAAMPSLARAQDSRERRELYASPSALIKPPRLKQGDLVGLIAPGGNMDDDGLQKCVRNLESIGMRVKLGKHVRAQHGAYAGTVAQRREDLQGMFEDREVNAIWAARGGQGCIALLPLLDYAAIRANAKILIGYSDITALHLALYRKAGLITFHGPVASSTFSPYSVLHMQNVLMAPQPEYTISMADENQLKALTAPQFEARAFHHGIVEGRLTGGNLSLVSALAGTPYAARFAGHIAFLEEIDEAPHRIDRMLA